jgi:hypothetical protein
MQIQTSWPLDEGSWIELYRGAHVIRARVIWKKGVRAGLLADEPLAVDEIASVDLLSGLPVAPARAERRRRPRAQDQQRLRGRAIEFVGVLAVVVVLVLGVFEDFQQAFARPLADVAQVFR